MSFRVCRHIKTDGIQCQSPAMREDKFCYFHTTLRRRHQPLANKPDTSTLRPVYDKDGKFSGMEPLGPPSGGIELGLLEDTASVQVAISTVVNALANNRLEVRRATALLYGLQLAASNCRSLGKDKPASSGKMVQETIGDTDGQPLAYPGLNSGNIWVYPDDPEDLYEHEEEEVRLAEQDGKDEEDEDESESGEEEEGTVQVSEIAAAAVAVADGSGVDESMPSSAGSDPSPLQTCHPAAKRRDLLFGLPEWSAERETNSRISRCAAG